MNPWGSFLDLKVMSLVRSSRLQFLMAMGFFAAAALLLAGGLYAAVMLAGPAAETPPPQAAAERQDDEARATVVVTTTAIRRGQNIGRAMLRPITVLGQPPANAFADPERVVGHVAVTDLHPNQVVVREAVSESKADAGLAVLVPQGKRAVAVRVNDEIAVGNFVRPGDHADLHVVVPGERGEGTEARVLLQDVQILSVGPRLDQLGAAGEDANGKPASRPKNLRDITILVTPQQANQIALVRGHAGYSLALRNPRDHTPVADVPVQVVDLRSGRTPLQLPAAALPRTPPDTPPPAPAKVTPPQHRIKIFTGGTVRTVKVTQREEER